MEPFRLHHGVTPHRSFKKYISQKLASFFRSSHSKNNKGFTLIELLVVLAIMTVITGIMITNQSSFNRTLILSNSAYDLALTLRATETYGISSRVTGSGVSDVGYGLHFGSAPTTSFILFADNTPSPSAFGCHGLPPGGATAPDARPGDCMYESSEGVTVYNLNNGITVSDFCAYVLGNWSCASTGLTSLDVVFARPDPNPFINGNGTRACLTLTSADGSSHRFVTVSASGAISANATSCP